MFVGHSFGTITVAWIRKMRPQIVDAMVLIDPVSVCLCWPKTAFNFVYRRAPTWFPLQPMQWIMSCGFFLTFFRIYPHLA